MSCLATIRERSRVATRIDTRRLSPAPKGLPDVRGAPQQGKHGLRHGSRQPGVGWGTFTQVACSSPLEIRFTPVSNEAFFARFGVLNRHNRCSALTALCTSNSPLATLACSFSAIVKVTIVLWTGLARRCPRCASTCRPQKGRYRSR